MARKRLLWQLFSSYSLVIIIALLIASWYGSLVLRQFYLNEVSANLKTKALLINEQIQKPVSDNDAANVNKLCKELGSKVSTRITVILPSGEVIGDSEEEPGRMDNHANRAEVKEALAGNMGSSTRFSHTLQTDMMYVAIPIAHEGKTIGALRTSVSLASIDNTLNAIYIKVAIGGLIASLIAAILSLLLSRRVSKPLEELKRSAEKFAQGDLNHKRSASNYMEVETLENAMSQMAEQLDDRIRTAVQQKNEQEAILSSMIEGVLAVDMNEQIITINDAAARLLSVNLDTVEGTHIREIIKVPELHDFVAETMASRKLVEKEMVLNDQRKVFLQMRGTVLRDAKGQGIGVLIVLHDVTKVRQLENIRRDFVANVSHELKTPITAIKGFVETLLDGSMQDPHNAERFLKIILKQAGRLNAIIEDLLSLSRIEQESGNAKVTFANIAVMDLLESAVQACEIKTAEKRIKINISCDNNLKAAINLQLMEQAIINLIDNAIKYSNADSSIEVTAHKNTSGIIITVRDEGCGIPAEHLPRLFERFYRVDKDRSRKLGGTGLGLAIVKYIAQAHGGHATVKSEVNKGSSFSINLPAV